MANGRNGARPKGKLELTWVGKENRPRLEPRILIEDRKLSYGDPNAENMLIHGDNLLALKALEQDFAGEIKCIYIDPPYNTGSAFTHYEDGLEHSIWLSMMRDRLVMLRELLSENGSIWISIDDNECHYLKVLCDEIFGRQNFVSNVIWQKIFSPKSTARHLSDMHDHVLLYARNKELWKRNLLPRSERHNVSYKNPDNDVRGNWTSGDLPETFIRLVHTLSQRQRVALFRVPPRACIGECQRKNLMNWTATVAFGGAKPKITNLD